MNIKIRSLFLVLFIISGMLPASSQAQGIEVCDNGVDDDNDGLIDLNDEDCACQIIEPISLIPNPSFEDQLCCPTRRSQMDCAATWIQASAPTTDYIHECGWLGWPNLPIPLPIPDGEGALGFRDGRFPQMENNNGGNSDNNPNWKEYAGACLTSPLKAGVSYTFRFYIGFTNAESSPPINVTFFGTSDCKNLPFGNGDSAFGCPTNGPGWTRLGVAQASGNNEWRQLSINITPTEDIHAITIGPPCNSSSASQNPYYFFDNLVLAEQSAFEFDIKADTQPCANDLSLSIPNYDSLTYQWYKNGKALIGETLSQLQQPPSDGRYIVVLTSSESCNMTRPFDFAAPQFFNQINQTICEGENLNFNNRQITTSGTYWDTLKSVNNCDSIIQLTLTINSNLETVVNAKIFPWEIFNIGNHQFSEKGTYNRTISSSFGCDSTVQLVLNHYAVYIPNIFSPNGDGVNDFFTITGGQDLTAVKDLTIIDRWGNQVYQQNASASRDSNKGWDGQSKGKKASTGGYLYTANLFMDDGKERAISGMVTLIR